MTIQLPVNCHPWEPEVFQPPDSRLLGLQAGNTGCAAGSQAIVSSNRHADQAGYGLAINRAECTAETFSSLSDAALEVASEGEPPVVEL